ncbi:MAG: hypothetical protein HY708_07480, partial [Ignavibacteriae bacterium]|nr:hypothetical protein [Ignavibacteriota bacterium]
MKEHLCGHTFRRCIVCASTFTALVYATALPLHAQHSEGEVTILQSSETSLVFEYRPQYTPPRTILERNVPYTLFDFEGSASRSTRDNAGSPDLRYRSFPLGLPSETGSAVQVIAADYEDIPDVLCVPIPTLHLRDDFIDVKGYEEDAAQYSRHEFLPGTVAELTTYGKNRSMILGSVLVFPLQYNPASKTLRRYSRIVIEVVYGSPAGPRIRNDDDVPFRNTLLNYNVARSWKFGDPRTPSKITGAPSVLANGTWYKLTVAEEGMYFLSAQFFASAGINLSGVDPRTLKIYGNGGRMLPENVQASRPIDLVENAIYVEGEADGRFDANDYVLFYGKGVRGGVYDSVARTMRHYINLYSEVNYYWLTFGGATQGKRMQVQPSLTDPPGVIPDRFPDIAFVEEEKVNLISSGKEWLGQLLNPGGSFTHILPLPGLIPNQSINYRYALVARSEPVPRFTVSESGTAIGSHTLTTVSYGSDFGYAQWGTFSVSANVSLTNSISQLNFAFSSASVGASGWIDWVEVVYPRNFNSVNNFLRFRSSDTAAVVEYRLGSFTSVPWIFNVTSHNNVARVSTTSMSFRALERAGGVSEYCAAAPGAWKVPIGIVGVPIQNLRGFTGHIDFVIITSQEFASAANRLKAHRVQPQFGDLSTMVVDVNHIYNEFGGGLPDITAVRDFLKYAYENWDPGNPLRFVLMFGAGSYDYKGILGSRSNFVPTWQGGLLYDGVWSYSSDDYFAQFGN